MDALRVRIYANAGFLYPFFGTLLGWLGVALTGSDTASNVLFGNLRRRSPPKNSSGLSPTRDGRGQFVRRRDGQDD